MVQRSATVAGELPSRSGEACSEACKPVAERGCKPRSAEKSPLEDPDRFRTAPREQVRDPATPVPLQGGHVRQRCRASVLKRLQPPSSTQHWRCAAAGSTRDYSAETAALFAEPSAGAFASRRCLHTLAAHRQFEGRGGHRSGRAEARRRDTDARAVRARMQGRRRRCRGSRLFDCGGGATSALAWT